MSVSLDEDRPVATVEKPESESADEAGQARNPVVTSHGAPPGLLGLVGIGSVNATCWLVGIFAGWLLDRHLGTTPVFILVGLVIGTVTGALSTYKEVRRYLSS